MRLFSKTRVKIFTLIISVLLLTSCASFATHTENAISEVVGSAIDDGVNAFENSLVFSLISYMYYTEYCEWPTECHDFNLLTSDSLAKEMGFTFECPYAEKQVIVDAEDTTVIDWDLFSRMDFSFAEDSTLAVEIYPQPEKWSGEVQMNMQIPDHLWVILDHPMPSKMSKPLELESSINQQLIQERNSLSEEGSSGLAKELIDEYFENKDISQ